MKCPNPNFAGMTQVTSIAIQAEIKNYSPNPSQTGGAQRLALLQKVSNLSELIDFCIEGYRAWGDAVLMGAGAYLKINDYSTEISAAKKYVKKQVESYLNGTPFSESEYDAWHKEICLTLADSKKHFASYSTYRKASSDKFKNKEGFTIGNAQKFLNMLMKDLYACLRNNSTLWENENKAYSYKDYFKYCHMPLDSYILWFVDDIRYRSSIVKSARTYTWSNLNAYNSYMDEQRDIRDYVRTNRIDPSITELQTEFVVWPLYNPSKTKSTPKKSSQKHP